jgi:hypothetical protein
MRDATIPHWLRMLGWGLLASALMHWMVLDLMRAAPQQSASRSISFRAVLRDAPRDAVRIESTATPSAQHMAPAAATRHATSEAFSTDPMPVVPPPANMSVNVNGIVGLRSGLAAEATVGLRLTLVQLLVPSLSAEVIPQAVLLWCDFDAAGHLLSVRSDSGPVSAVVLSAVQRAAAQLSVPDALIGSAFSLDVLLEPGA